MQDSGCPLKRWQFRLLVCAGLFFASPARSQSIEIAPRLTVEFPANGPDGAASTSAVIPRGEGSTVVAVVGAGADGSRPVLSAGGRTIAGEVIGWDPVSRLSFIRTGDGISANAPEWLDEVGPMANASLKAAVPGESQACQTRGWVKQVGGKVLPLALLKVSFTKAAPPAGTPLTNSSGQVVAVVFQSDGTANGGYAIPAEAVARVARDIPRQKRLVRGWIGLSLKPESPVPQVVRVLQDTPAAKAGIRAEDIVVAIGGKTIESYADAVNAFFYLLPGEPVLLQVSRGTERLDFHVTPMVQTTP